MKALQSTHILANCACAGFLSLHFCACPLSTVLLLLFFFVESWKTGGAILKHHKTAISWRRDIGDMAAGSQLEAVGQLRGAGKEGFSRLPVAKRDAEEVD